MSTVLKTEDEFGHARENAKGWLASIEDMLVEYGKWQDDNTPFGEMSRDAARKTIEESVLSVQIRDGWRIPGDRATDDPPDEYEILLTTGGPALRIIGQLDDYCQPKSAELQMQDWGTPWTRCPAPEATLLAFASVFWFGE